MVLAVGILGATVMPHVIYLHSALTQDRDRGGGDVGARRLLRYTRIDVVIAMAIAGLINLVDARDGRGTFAESGLPDVDSLEGAHDTLEPILGSTASAIFAIALLGSGLSSSAVGTLVGPGRDAGLRPPPDPVCVRRLRDDVPAFVVVAIGVDPSRTLVLSQVVLSFGIPFALIPLVLFTRAARPDGRARQPADDDRGRRRSSPP